MPNLPSPSSLPTDFAPAERATDEALRLDVEHFRAETSTNQMLDAVPDIFLVLNRERQVVFANQVLFDFVGETDPQQVYGQRLGELLDCTHSTETLGGCGTTRFCSMCGAARAIMTGLGGEQSVEECSITQKSGSALDLRVWAKPLTHDDKPYTMFAVQDISDEKRRRSLERIFFHDVLNTAGIIWNVVELVRMDSGLYSKVEGQLDAASKRLVDEIRSQQILMSAESGDLQLMPEPVEPVALLYTIADLSQYYVNGQAIDVVVADDLPSLEIATDKVLLTRVIANMAKNAIEASKDGDTVTLGYTTTSDTIIFEVHNPAYMPYHVQLQVFKRSFSTKGAGRGLGTYSIKLLTERYLGGRAWFESDDTAGTTFKIALSLGG